MKNILQDVSFLNKWIHAIFRLECCFLCLRCIAFIEAFHCLRMHKHHTITRKSRSTEKLSRSGKVIFIENANSVTLLFVLYCSKQRNGVENMIYKCDNPYCGFLFERVGEVDCCPDCGHDDIRPANEEEQKEYLERKNKKR